jgi:hypothetical protein
LGDTDADLRAGWMELSIVQCHGKVEGDDLVTDSIVS